LSGPTFIGSAYGPTPPSGWELIATADFNGNGYPDYLLYNSGTRRTAIWYLNNSVFVSAAWGPTNNNTAHGFRALHHNTTGSFNITLGNLAGNNLTTGSNNIDIGNVGVAGESATIRIGTAGTQTATFVAGISGVVVNAIGNLGVIASSARFKEAIKPMDKASEAILALQPVTFRYKPELDPDGSPQFGLVAEQVEKVNPDLVARDENGQAYTVRYEAVNTMFAQRVSQRAPQSRAAGETS
jgi:Chaperone of endosialidase